MTHKKLSQDLNAAIFSKGLHLSNHLTRLVRDSSRALIRFNLRYENVGTTGSKDLVFRMLHFDALLFTIRMENKQVCVRNGTLIYIHTEPQGRLRLGTHLTPHYISDRQKQIPE